jgi:hypothetical protein
MATRGRVRTVGGVGVNPNLSQPLRPPTFDLSGLLQTPSTPISSQCSVPVEEETAAAGPTFDPTIVLLRRVLFLSHIKNRYVSVGFYPALNYKVLVEFGGPRITPICLTEQQIKTLWDNLPNLCDAMCRSEFFTCKNALFRLQTTATVGVAKMYLGRTFTNSSSTSYRI